MVILNRIKMLDMAFELGSDTQAVNRQVDSAFELGSDTQAVNRQVDRAFELGSKHKGLSDYPPPPLSAATAGRIM